MSPAMNPILPAAVISVLSVAVILSIIACGVGFLSRRRYPGVEHSCWVIVLLRLLLPPILMLEIPGLPVMPFHPDSQPATHSLNRHDLAARTTTADPSIRRDSPDFDKSLRFPQPLLKNENPALPQPSSSATSSPAVATNTNSGFSGSTPSSNPDLLKKTLPESATGTDPVTVSSPQPVPAMTLETESGSSIQTVLQTLTSFRFLGTCLGAVWVIGSLVVLLRYVRALRAFRRLLRLAKPASQETIAMAQQIAAQIGLCKVPPIVTLDARIAPLVWSGFRSPVIVLPQAMDTGHNTHFDRATNQYLLAHEFAHVRRRDYWVRWMELAVQVLWWWCPLVLVVRRRLRTAEEAACDAWVTTLWRESAANYAQAIIKTVLFVGDQPLMPLLATGGLGSLRELKNRLRDIESHQAAPRLGFATSGVLAVLAIFSCSLFLVGTTSPDSVVPPSDIITGADNRTTNASEPSEASNLPADVNRLQQVRPEQAVAFDSAKCLTANRLWQNPTLDSIESLEFTHRMFPERLDERFVWRRDHTSLIEVLHRADESEQYGTGWQLLNLSDASSFTSHGPESFPRFRKAQERSDEGNRRRPTPLTPIDLLRRSTLEHLCGTLFHFPSIEWGRRPDEIHAVDYQRKDGLHIVELRPTATGHGSFDLHAGAMFHTTSWSYMHDVTIDRSVLTIDDQYRILKEEDWLQDQRIAVIEFSDWLTNSKGEHAPGRIRIQMTPAALRRRSKDPDENKEVPEFVFDCDQRFQLTPEGFWCLKRGSSKFADSDVAQQEELTNIKFNSADGELNRRIEDAKRRSAEMEPSVNNAVPIAIQGLTSFELGNTYAVRTKAGNPDEDPANQADAQLPQSLRFMPFDSLKSDPAQALTAELILELNFPATSGVSQLSADGSYLLALYDEDRSPIYAASIPQAAVNTPVPNAANVFPQLLTQCRLWLDPAAELPSARYSFRLSGSGQLDGKDRTFEGTIPGGHHTMRRGITLRTALDSMYSRPELFRVPVAFTAMWNGRAVHVYGITGPGFLQEFGSGLSTVFVGGYSTRSHSSFILITDAATGQPIAEQSESVTFEYQDYVQTADGQLVPLRITCRSNNMSMDLRFQCIDDRLWLFDHKAGEVFGVPGSVSDLTIDGQIPGKIVKSQRPDNDPLPLIMDWTQFTSRQMLRENDALTGFVMGSTSPWTDSSWMSINRLSRDVNAAGITTLRHSIRSAYRFGFPMPKYWTLTRQSANNREPLICIEAQSADNSVESLILQLEPGASVPNPVPSRQLRVPQETQAGPKEPLAAKAPEQTRLFRLLTQREQGGLLQLTPEVLSTDYYHGQTVEVTAVIVDESGTPVSGGSSSLDFRTYSVPKLAILPSLQVPVASTTANPRVVYGTTSVVTSAPMGSRWGMFMNDEPLFETKVLLASGNPVVRQIGLQQLYNERRHDIAEYFSARRGGDRDNLRHLIPHRDTVLEILQRATGSVGASNSEPDTDQAIALACRIVGRLDEQELTSVLKPLLTHKAELVRDSAAVGLGLLREPAGRDRLRELEELLTALTEESLRQRGPYAVRRDEVDWALQRVAEK